MCAMRMNLMSWARLRREIRCRAALAQRAVEVRVCNRRVHGHRSRTLTMRRGSCALDAAMLGAAMANDGLLAAYELKCSRLQNSSQTCPHGGRRFGPGSNAGACSDSRPGALDARATISRDARIFSRFWGCACTCKCNCRGHFHRLLSSLASSSDFVGGRHLANRCVPAADHRRASVCAAFSVCARPHIVRRTDLL